MSEPVLVVPAASVERLAVKAGVIGVPDPTALDVFTAFDAAADQHWSPAPTTGWQTAGWLNATTIRTHLISGQAAGTYGLWVKIAADDEAAVLWSGRVVLV